MTTVWAVVENYCGETNIMDLFKTKDSAMCFVKDILSEKEKIEYYSDEYCKVRGIEFGVYCGLFFINDLSIELTEMNVRD